MNEILLLGQIIISVGASIVILSLVAHYILMMLSGQDGGGTANLIFVQMAADQKENSLTKKVVLIGFTLSIIGVITYLSGSFW